MKTIFGATLAATLFAVLLIIGPHALAMFGHGLPPMGTTSVSPSGSCATAPSNAQLAGFATKVICADFTAVGGAYSNTASFMVNCGASASVANTPSSWHFYNVYPPYGSTQQSCGESSITTDSVCGGCQILMITWPISASNQGGMLSFPIPNAINHSGSKNTNWMPNEYYTKEIIRTDTNTIFQGGSAVGTTGHIFWGSTSQTEGGGTWLDENHWEEWENPPVNQIWCGTLQEWTPTFTPYGTICGTADMTVYHTVENLVTSDESTGVTLCLWLDGVFQSCTSHGLSVSSSYTDRDRIFVSEADRSYNSGNPLTFDSHTWKQRFEVWTCAGFATGTCPGSTFVNGGGSSPSYWH
jgi:hypothetical protein